MAQEVSVEKKLGTAAGITAGILVLAYIVLAYYR